MRVLITGINSLLGKYTAVALHENGYDVWGTNHTIHVDPSIPVIQGQIVTLDVTQEKKVKETISGINPQVIIHLASLSNIDYCEKNPDEARKVNVVGTQNIVNHLQGTPTYFIFASSNAVFDGVNPPYKENDDPHPLNIYGKTKYDAEKIAVTHPFSTVIRFTTLFGWQPLNARKNDLTYYLQQLTQNKPIYLVDDLFFNPVSALTAGEVIKKIIEKKAYSIFHVAGKAKVSRYKFIQEVLKVFKVKNYPALIPVNHSYFQNLAPRPIDACLSTEKIEKELMIQFPELDHELKIMNDAIIKSHGTSTNAHK